MNLESLPVEVLAQILQGQLSWAALELWKTGSKPLRAKLASSGVRNIDLVGHPTTLRLLRWPRALKEFRGLRSLSIVYNWDGPVEPPRVIHRELLQLTSGLKHLTLGIEQAFGAFFLETPPHDDNGGLPPFKRFDCEEADAKNAARSIQTSVSSVLNELETLEFRRFNEFAPALTTHTFALLPRSLTAFAVKYDAIPKKLVRLPLEDASADFPPNLTKLDIPLSTASLRNLPKCITQIGNVHDREVAVALFQDPTLLPNLEWLPCPGIGSSARFNASAAFLGADMEHWPPHIHALRLTDLPPSLPAKLVKLDVQPELGPLSQGWVTSILPKSLEELVIYDFDWNDISSADWPPNLASIALSSGQRIPISSGFGFHHFHRLPRSLTALSVNLYRSWADSKEDDLLALGRDCLTNIEKQVWSKHRFALIFHGEKDGGREREAMAEYISSIESGSLFGLPLCLKRLELRNCFPFEHVEIVVPPVLESVVQVLQEVIYLKHFPPSLKHFSSRVRGNPTRPLLWDSAYFAKHSASALSLSHLESFTMPLSCAFPATLDDLDALLKALPSSIRHIDMSGGSIGPIIPSLASLPRTLTSFTSSCVLASATTSECLHALPDTLTHLYVRNANIHGPLWAHLPPKLVKLYVTIGPTTLADFLTAPRTLEWLCLQDVLETEKTSQYLQKPQLEAITEAFYPLWKAFHVPIEKVRRIASNKPAKFKRK